MLAFSAMLARAHSGGDYDSANQSGLAPAYVVDDDRCNVTAGTGALMIIPLH